MSDLAYLLTGSPDEKITWHDHATMYGGTIWGSRRSIAHLEATDQTARKRFGVGITVIQSAYNTGVAASAGTHDYDSVYDVYLAGVDWWEAQHFLREQGWAAWYRYPPTFGNHVHMVSLGYTTRVGIYVPGQVSDYYAHRNGLAGHAADNTWHPADIDSTVFDYAAWVRQQEDDMPYDDWPKADRESLCNDVARAVTAALLAADVFPKKADLDVTVRQALADAADKAARRADK